MPALRFLAGSLQPPPGLSPCRLRRRCSGRAPVGCPLTPVGGMTGGAALGCAIGYSAHGHPPSSRLTGNRCRSAQMGTLVVAEVAEEVVGALGAPPSPLAPSCHLSAWATHQHGAFAKVTPRGQCHQPGTPTALRAGGLDSAHCPQPRAAAGWAGGTRANSKRDDPQGARARGRGSPGLSAGVSRG